jgi:hypothetical protein
MMVVISVVHGLNKNIDTVGYHYYMTPEVAKIGIELLNERKKIPGKKWNYKDYPDLKEMSVFK